MQIKRQIQNALNIYAGNRTNQILELYRNSLDYYNNGIKSDHYNYLLKIGKDKKFTLPAKARRIDRLTPRLRYLKSRETSRKIPLTVRLTDADSIRKKNKRIVIASRKKFLEQLEIIFDEQIKERKEYESMIFDLNDHLEQIKQEIVQNVHQAIENGAEQSEIPSAEQIHLQAMQEYHGRLKRLMEIISYKIDYLIKKNKGYNELFEEIKKQMALDYTDEVEANIDVLLRELIRQYDLDAEKSIAFDYSLKTALGAEYYYVDIHGNDPYPRMEALSPLDVMYPQTKNIWVQDGDWVMIRRNYTKLQLIDIYGLSGKVLDMVEQKDIFYGADTMLHTYPNGNGESVTHEVYHIFWKDTKQVKVAISDNKYNKDAPHIHIIDEDKKPRNAKIETRPYVEIWEAVVYDNEFIVPPRVVPDVVRFENDFNNPKLPVVGLVFDTGLRYPYSLVLQTKDASELSKVIQIKLELLIAASGTKGMVMDDSQRPANMTRDEWMYLRKMGTAWIQSMKNGRPANFNQFQQYDDTIPQSITTLLNIDEALDRHFDLVTGVTRQSLAQIEQYELKGTTTQAINQTLAIVESIYQTHEQIYTKAIEQYTNLLGKYCNTKNITIDAEDVNSGFTTIRIDANELTERDIRVSVDKDYADQNILEVYKQIAIHAAAQKAIPLNALSVVLTSSSFRKMDRKLAALLDEYNQKMVQYSSQAERQKNAEMFQYDSELEKLKGEIQKQLKEYDLQINRENINSSLESLRMQLERYYTEIDIKNKQLEVDYELGKERNAIQNKAVEKDAAVEVAYLQEQKRQAIIMEQLKAIELKLNAISNTQKNVIENKKITRSKEKIKD